MLPVNEDQVTTEWLTAALRRSGVLERGVVRSVRGAAHTSQWFHRIESANDFVVYVADPTASSWTSLCVRQADALMLLARADSAPGEWPVLANQRNADTAPQRAELVTLVFADDVARKMAINEHAEGDAFVRRLAADGPS